MAARSPALRSLRRRSLSSEGTRSAAAAVTNDSPPVGIFCDLDNKPLKTLNPFSLTTAVGRLRLAVSSLGPVALSFAYSDTNSLLSRAASAAADDDGGPRVCGVCGRNFYNRSKLVHHFKQLHEREHAKRLRRLEASCGGQRVRLAAKFSMKMKKYEREARELLAATAPPPSENVLAEEFRRSGFLIRKLPSSSAAAAAMEFDITDVLRKKTVGCVVLVSEDPKLAGVLKDARERRVKTAVVVSNNGGASLRRCADAVITWDEVVSGKAKKEAETVASRWKDGELLRKLEWKYQPEKPNGEDEDGGEL